VLGRSSEKLVPVPDAIPKESSKAKLAAVSSKANSKDHVSAAKSRPSTKKASQHMAAKPLIQSFDKTTTKPHLHGINEGTEFFGSKENEVQLPTFLDDNSPAALSAAASAIAKAASEVADQSQEERTNPASDYHNYVIFKPTLPPSMPSDSIQSFGPSREDEDAPAGAGDKGKEDELASIERRLKNLETMVAEMAESKGSPASSIEEDTHMPETAARTASFAEGGEAEAREASEVGGAEASNIAENARASPDAVTADAADAATGVAEEEDGSITPDAREDRGAEGDRGHVEEGGRNPEADAAIEKALHDFARMSKMAAAERARQKS
jgi:hypothetical protein